MSATASSASTNSQAPQTRWFVALIIAFAIVTLAVLAAIVGVAIAVTDGGGLTTTVEVIRDLFVIMLALELVLIGAAFTLVLVQLARFANLIQNEIRPILDSSSDAVNTIRGTATFLSEHAVEPVMQLNSMMAGARQAMKLVTDLDTLRNLARAAATDGSSGSGPGAATSDAGAD